MNQREKMNEKMKKETEKANQVTSTERGTSCYLDGFVETARV